MNYTAKDSENNISNSNIDSNKTEIIEKIIKPEPESYNEKYIDRYKWNIRIDGIPETYIPMNDNKLHNCLDVEGKLYVFKYDDDETIVKYNLYNLFEITEEAQDTSEPIVHSTLSVPNLETESKHQVILTLNNDVYTFKPTYIGKYKEDFLYSADMDYLETKTLNGDGYFHMDKEIEYDPSIIYVRARPFIYVKILQGTANIEIKTDYTPVENSDSYYYIKEVANGDYNNDYLELSFFPTDSNDKNILVEFY